MLGVTRAETCPWMNAATAGGFLGGDVTAKFTPDTAMKGAGVCEFARTANFASATLRIEVSLMHAPATEFAAFLAKCGSDAKPLKAIGNEAVTCSVPHKGSRVVGRVRDQAFVITLIPEAQEGSIKKAAEIIAGNLF